METILSFGLGEVAQWMDLRKYERWNPRNQNLGKLDMFHIMFILILEFHISISLRSSISCPTFKILLSTSIFIHCPTLLTFLLILIFINCQNFQRNFFSHFAKVSIMKLFDWRKNKFKHN